MVSVVPLAVVKPNHVVVVLVPVELVQIKPVNVPLAALVAPMVVPLMVPPEIVALEEVRLMMLPVVPEAVVKPNHVAVALVAVKL